MAFILGVKKEMTQLFKDNKIFGVTIVEAGPCFIIDAKTKGKDGYQAIQLTFGKKRKVNKPLKGQIKNMEVKPRWIREFKISEKEKELFKPGEIITTDKFKEGERVDVQGVSIGKGFQGVVKRYGFKGKNASHGTKHDQRRSGSIGATGPQRVFEGKKMGGRTGGEKKTIKKLEILKIDSEKNLIYLKGAVPGKRDSLLKIRSSIV